MSGTSRAETGNAIDGPFARVSLEEMRRARARGMPTQWAVWLALLMWRRRDAAGRWIVSRPRAEVARELGVSEGAVSDAVRRLRRAGALDVVSAGHNGRASVYALPDSGDGATDGREDKEQPDKEQPT